MHSGEGKCTACDAQTTDGKYHKVDPEKLLCTGCFAAEETRRADARAYRHTPTGHALGFALVADLIGFIEDNDVQGNEGGWDTLLDFLEPQLASKKKADAKIKLR